MAVVTAGAPATWTGQAAHHPPGPGAPWVPAYKAPRTLRSLRRLRILLAVGALLFGAASVWATQVSADGAGDARSHAGPLTAQAETLYYKLSDADATAATIYLQVGQEPAALDTQYHDDLTQASAALTAATALASGDQAMTGMLQSVGAQLHEYIELNATATANNLQGFPVGIRYLARATDLMQNHILTTAQAFSQAADDKLSRAQDTAGNGGLQWFPGAALLMLAALTVVQIRESRRTHRLVNPGLLLATGALLVTCAWLVVAFSALGNQEDEARRQGSNQARALGSARSASLQARTDEMAVLVGRGVNDSSMNAYKSSEWTLQSQLDSAKTQARADGSQLTADQAALDDEQTWNTADAGIMKDYLNNRYGQAVASAIGTGKASDGTDSHQAYQKLQTDLGTAIDEAEAAFRQHSAAAADALTGAEIGAGALALLMAAGIVVGLGRRIAEYS